MPLVKTDRIPPPSFGLHEDVPMGDYLAWRAVSKSVLESMRTSPAHALACESFHSEETPATRLGTAIHSAILEPELFESSYGKIPPGDGRSALVKAARAALVSSGKIGLTESDWEVCSALRDKAWAKSTVRDLLEQATHIEVSGSFPTSVEGIVGKLRPDILCADARTCVDLKSAKDASAKGFQKAIGQHAYYLSPGWYLPGLFELGVDCEHWVWVALEKTYPYGVACYAPERHEIERSKVECRDLLEAYDRCSEGKVWPDYPDTILSIVRPKWA